MEKRVLNNIQENQLFEKNDSLIIGVSGGADSMVLLNILVQLGYKCIVAHCNFQLRKEESDTDEQFVSDYCERNQLVFEHITFNTKKIALERKISIEMAARDLRYDWFEQVRINHNAKVIVVAHHANDQAETILMNLTRGTGLTGLTGMKFKNGCIVRPLLNISRQSIEDYSRLKHISFRYDSTNAESDFTRNKIRNQIIPLLEEINPSLIDTFISTSKRLLDLNTFTTSKIKEIASRIIETEGELIYIKLDDAELKSNAEYLLFELLYPYGFANEQISKICASLEKESGRMFYSQTHQLNTDRDRIIISPLKSIATDDIFILDKVQEYESPIHITLSLKDFTSDFKISKESQLVHLDFKKIKFPLKLRKWKHGDQFYPFGMNKSKKVSDFFIDLKISRTEKDRIWILCDHTGTILWILGLRLDNRFRVDNTTQKILEISI